MVLETEETTIYSFVYNWKQYVNFVIHDLSVEPTIRKVKIRVFQDKK